MDKQQILEEINKTKEHLLNMEKALKECEYKRWKPELNEEYWVVNNLGTAYNEIWTGCNTDQKRYNFYNCFKTREQAVQEAEKIFIRRKLEDIAKRLNRGKEIDCGSRETKYFLNIDNDNNVGYGAFDLNYRYKIQGIIYCLDINFKDVAIQEIGQERLIKYLRGE